MLNELREILNHWRDPELRVVSYFISGGNLVDWAYPCCGSNTRARP